jgi:hypothetical protein
MNAKSLAIGQGIFYFISGVWPIAHYESFEKVTGPKIDDWLVKTMGGMIASTGLSLIQGAVEKDSKSNLFPLGALPAFVLGTSAGYYATKGRISKIYFLDAFVEYSIVTAWIRYFVKSPLRKFFIFTQESWSASAL